MQQSTHHPPLTTDHMVIGGTCSTNRSNHLMDSRLMSRRQILVGMASLGLVGGAMSFLEACGSSSTASPHAKLNKPTMGTTLLTYRGHTSPVPAIAWSPDSTLLVSGGGDRTAQVCEASSGKLLFTYRGHRGTVRSLSWSPDGKRIASAGFTDLSVQVWDALTGSSVLTYFGHFPGVTQLAPPPPPPAPNTPPPDPKKLKAVTHVAWSPDGKYIASACTKNAQVWDATTGHTIYTYTGHTDWVNRVVWSPDGTRIASCSNDKAVHVWDATTGGNVLTYSGHADLVLALAWSPNGKWCASGAGFNLGGRKSVDTTVQVWDAATGSRLSTYHGYAGQLWNVAWSPDSKRLAGASFDGTVQISDPTTASTLFTYRGHKGWVGGLTWSPDGTRLASGGFDKTLQVWEAR